MLRESLRRFTLGVCIGSMLVHGPLVLAAGPGAAPPADRTVPPLSLFTDKPEEHQQMPGFFGVAPINDLSEDELVDLAEWEADNQFVRDIVFGPDAHPDPFYFVDSEVDSGGLYAGVNSDGDGFFLDARLVVGVDLEADGPLDPATAATNPTAVEIWGAFQGPAGEVWVTPPDTRSTSSTKSQASSSDGSTTFSSTAFSKARRSMRSANSPRTA